MDYYIVHGVTKSQTRLSDFHFTAFFIFQLSHLYMTIGKTIDLTIWTFVSKVMPLLLNTVSGFVIVFLPRSSLLIYWLQVTIHIDFRAQEEVFGHCFHLFPFYLP